MQLRDVRNLLSTVTNIDTDYIGKWAAKLGLDGIYKELSR